MRVSEGTRLGHYEIQRAIGAGGMGEVYRARDTRLQRPAAIKIITAEDADGELIRRLEREALSASALNHPNILTVYELGVHEGLHYIATEPSKERRSARGSGAARSPLTPPWTSRFRSPPRSTPPTPPASSIATSSRKT